MSAFHPLRTFEEGTKINSMRLDPKRRAEDSLAIFAIWTLFVGVFAWGGIAYAGGVREWFSSIGAVFIVLSPILPLALWLRDRRRARD
jgi:hypothetical protein